MIKPGDLVESISDDAKKNREYVVHEYKGDEPEHQGKFYVKNDSYHHYHTPEEFSQRYRLVTQSPAVRFVSLFFQKEKTTTDRQMYKVKQSLIKTILYAGLEFWEGDFRNQRQLANRTYDSLKPKNYLLDIFSFNEGDYAEFIDSGNMSAIKEFERHIGRTPWLYVDLAEGRNGAKLVKRRLHVGSTIQWEKDLSLNITSFKDRVDDKGNRYEEMIGCVQEYETAPICEKCGRGRYRGRYRGKIHIKKIVPITHEMLDAKVKELQENFKAVKDKLSGYVGSILLSNSMILRPKDETTGGEK